jgi:hypothetical protein
LKRNRNNVLWIVAILLLSSFAGISLNATAQPDNVYVDGYVLESGSGTPIGNATIVLQNTWDSTLNSTTTDASGYYNLSIHTPMPGGAEFTLTAFHEDYLSGVRNFWLNPGSPQYWEIYLDPALNKNSSIHGKVLDAVTMTPLPFAGIAALGGNYVNTTSTNATGYYWMKLESDHMYYIQAQYAGYEAVMDSGFLGFGQNRSFNFMLEPTNCTLKGYVEDLGGVPLGFASVRVYRSGDPQPTEFNPRVNMTTGYFELNLSRGVWHVEVTDGMHFSQTQSVLMFNGLSTWQNFTLLNLPSGRATVQGWVTYYHNGSGVPYANIGAENMNSTWNGFNMTNETGYYSIRVLPGDIRFDAWQNQYGGIRPEITATDGGNHYLNITLYDWWASGWIEGYVRLNGTGEPDSNVMVTLGGGRWEQMTDGSGFYNISVPAAPVTVQGYKDGYKHDIAQVNVTADETTYLDLDLGILDWTCELNGFINNTNGRPLEGTYASFDYDGPGWDSATAGTDYTGFYQKMAPAGEASYFIFAEDHEYKTGSVDLPSDQIFWFNETLEPVKSDARIIARFTDIYTGKPLKNVEIRFSEMDLQWFASKDTNQNGIVRMDVPSGFVGVSFDGRENGYKDPGMSRDQSKMQFLLKPSEIRWLNISLFPKEKLSTFRGFVNDTGSNPIPGAVVSIRYGDMVLSNTTDGSGYYEIRLPGDQWFVAWVRAPGYKMTQDTISIGQRENRWYDWVLDSSPASIEGPITDSAADLDGDSKYDVLYVNVTVNVYQIGDYRLDASLAESRNSNQRVAGAEVEFGDTLGSQMLTLEFMGEQIRLSELDGYYVDINLINNQNWDRLDWAEHYTAKYTHDQFEKPDVKIETPVEHWLVDTDLDGLFNYLVFNVTVNVSVAGDYTIMAPAADIWGSEFDMTFETYSLEVGLQEVQVTLDGTSIFNNGKRLGSIAMIVFEGLPTGGMDYIDYLGFYIPYDHDIFQFYEIDSFVSGFVTDMGNQPIEGINIWLYNITQKFLNETETDASGYFELGGWAGDWILVVNDHEDDNIYEGDLTEITLSQGMTTRDFLNLPYVELDEVETQLIFPDWNITMIDWLLFAKADDKTLRFEMDVLNFGNGDGFLSEEEVEFVMGMIGTLELPANSNESFLVDGIWYDLNQSSVTRDVGLVGHITSTDPVYIHMTGDYVANTTIPLPSPHDLTLNTSYDNTDSGNFIGNNVTHIVYVVPPSDWGRTGNGVPINVTITGSDYITIDAGEDPNQGDDQNWEWVNVTISAGEIPTVGSIKGNVTLQGGSSHGGVQVTIYLNGTMTEVERGHVDPTGYYEIPGIPAGNYDVVAHKPGYMDNWSYNVNLNAGDILWIDFTLFSFPPTISHSPVISGVLGDPIQVAADVSDDGSVDEVILYYKDVGSGSYSSTIMTKIPSTSTYLGTIPAQVSLGYVDYYIWANDTKGNSATHPSVGNHSIWIYEITPPDISLVTAVPDPAEYPEFVNVSAMISDMSPIITVNMSVEFPDMSTTNLTMTFDSLSGRYYLNSSYTLLGTYNYVIWANDSFDNWNSYSGSFDVLDTILPTSSTDLILPYWFATSPAVLTAQASDSGIGVENVELWFRHSLDNSTWGNWTLFGTDTGALWSWDFTFPDGDGYYEFFTIANDSAGNPEAMKNVAEAICAYDTTGPTSGVNIISTYWQSSSPLTITAFEDDPMIGTENIELWYRNSTDNATWSSWMQFGLDTGAPWSWSFNFPEGNGYYEFYSIANDSLGNSESGKAVWETICAYDTIEPSSGLDDIAPYWHSVSPAVINGSASDNLAGVSEVELYYRSSSDNASWGAWVQFTLDTSAPWSWDFTFPDGDGYYEFYSIAYDAVGNAEAFKPSYEALCAYDTTAPTSMINVTATYWISTSPFTITAFASDDLVGTDTVELWYRNSTDNSTWGAWTLFAGDASAPWSWDFNFPAGDGYYEFFSISQDALGNIETMKVVAEFICALDNTGPSSMVDDISQYWQTGPSTTITATASDPRGVDRVTLWYRYSDDDSSWGSWSNYDTDSSSPWSFSFDYPDGDGYYQFYSIARDQLGNDEASKSSFEAELAIDTQVPTLDSMSISPDPTELGEDITISISPTDVAGIAEAWIEITLGTTSIGNFSMTQSGSDYEYVYNPDEIGTASFVIWVSDGNGNWNTISDSVEVEDTEGPTISDFTIIPSDPEVGSDITVTVNASDHSVISDLYINITDPDGNFVLNESMTMNPATGAYSHQSEYDILGNYPIEIWAVDGNGQVTLLSETITTTDDEDPVADAGVDQQVTVGTQVTLEASGSTDNHLIANYTWEFNDNGLKRLYGETPQYTFSSSGAYQITLKVRDFAGNSHEAKTWVNVTAVTGVGTISGVVLDKNGDPVEGALVYVDGNPSLEDTTDSAGRYTIEDVPIGQRTITVVKDGYVRDSIDVDVEADQTANPPPIALAKKSTEEESPMALIGILIAIIAIVIVLLLFLMTRKKPVAVPEETVIDEVFLMYNDGRLIKHFTRRLKPDMDEDILSSMLVAVQDFVKDSFRDQEGMLDEMNFGRFQVLLGRGEHIILATIVLGDDPTLLKSQVTQCVKDIEEKYADVLHEWDGDMQSIKGAAKYVMDLIDGRYAEGQ